MKNLRTFLIASLIATSVLASEQSRASSFMQSSAKPSTGTMVAYSVGSLALLGGIFAAFSGGGGSKSSDPVSQATPPGENSQDMSSDYISNYDETSNDYNHESYDSDSDNTASSQAPKLKTTSSETSLLRIQSPTIKSMHFDEFVKLEYFITNNSNNNAVSFKIKTPLLASIRGTINHKHLYLKINEKVVLGVGETAKITFDIAPKKLENIFQQLEVICHELDLQNNKIMDLEKIETLTIDMTVTADTINKNHIEIESNNVNSVYINDYVQLRFKLKNNNNFDILFLDQSTLPSQVKYFFATSTPPQTKITLKAGCTTEIVMTVAPKRAESISLKLKIVSIRADYYEATHDHTYDTKDIREITMPITINVINEELPARPEAPLDLARYILKKSDFAKCFDEGYEHNAICPIYARDILNIDKNEKDCAKITKAFRKISNVFHPDRHPSSEKAFFDNVQKMISGAYTIIRIKFQCISKMELTS